MMEPSMNKIPKGAIGALSGLYVKIGAHGRVYYWNGEDWLRSEKNEAETLSKLRGKKDKFSLTGAGENYGR